jgi:hypothetical protein
MAGPEPGRKIQIHITDSDRLVEVTLDENPDAVQDDVADALVRALGTEDPHDAERELASSLDDLGRVRRGP